MSNDPTSQHEPSHSDPIIDSIVDAFVEQALENGRPDIEGACERYPEFADRIRQAAASLKLLVDQHSQADGGVDSENLRNDLAVELSRHSRTRVDPTLGSTKSVSTDYVRIFGNRYRLREELGEGGFGVVYVAEQKEPVRRKVAIKVVKRGMDSKEVLSRFDAERQALAMMDHPNVAQVFDGGVTEDGRPYFVMELIRGVSITKFCDLQKLGLNERLEIFRDVCHAVQHAHLKGIIHRDIKPSNVLVTMRDDRPFAKVIDFGVAKALHRQLSEDSVYTAFGQMVGTPLYMSPEQIQLSEFDVDTRSDIYSLGVLLYELITGDTPFTRDSLMENGIQAFREMVCDSEPPRPSHRISTLKASDDPTVVDKRHFDGRELKRLSGELDWIVMKALEKDRQKRYQSANDFAMDVDRLLNGDEVLAKPPTLLYRASKVIKRNKAVFATIGAVIAALTIGILTTLSQVRRAENAEQDAVAALDDSNEQRELAEQRLAFAEQAVDDMYTQFAEKWISKEQGLSQVQREFLEKALEIYRQLADSSDGSRSFESVQKALRRVAAINTSLGDDSAALIAQKEVVSFAKAKWAENPDDLSIQLDYVSDCITLARLFGRLGDNEQGNEWMNQALIALRDNSPEELNDAWQRRSFTSSAAALARHLGKDVATVGKGEQLAAIAVKTAEKLYTDFPGDARVKRLATGAYSAQAYCFLHRPSRAQECLEAYDKAVSIYEDLVASKQSTKNDLYNFSTTLSNKGLALRKMSPGTDLTSLLTRIVEIEREAHKRFPDDIETYQRLADGLNKASLYANETGNFPAATKFGLEAKDIAEVLVRRFPQRVSSWSQLISAHWGLADRERLSKNFASAVSHYRDMYRVASKARERYPHSWYLYQKAISATLLEGRVCLEMRDYSRFQEVATAAEECLSVSILTEDGAFTVRSIEDACFALDFFEVFRDQLRSAVTDLRAFEGIDSGKVKELQAVDQRLATEFENRMVEWATFVTALPDQRDLFRDRTFVASPAPDFFLPVYYFDSPPEPGIGHFATARSRMRSVEGLIAHLLESGESWAAWPELLFVATSFEWSADKTLLERAMNQLDADDPKHRQARAWCLFRLGQFEACSALFETEPALESDENRFIRAMLAWKLEDPSKARNHLGRGKIWLEKHETELQNRASIEPMKHVPDVAILERLVMEANYMITPAWASWLLEALDE